MLNGICFYVVDSTGTIVSMSDNVFPVFGFHAHKVVGQKLHIFVHPDDIKGLIEAFINVICGEKSGHIFRIVSRNGENIRVQADSMYRNSQIIGIMTILEDEK